MLNYRCVFCGVVTERPRWWCDAPSCVSRYKAGEGFEESPAQFGRGKDYYYGEAWKAVASCS